MNHGGGRCPFSPFREADTDNNQQGDGATRPSGFTIDELFQIEQAIASHSTHADNNLIPAGYTYLGQLIAHDLSYNSAALLDGPDAFDNNRTPVLDLDCLYGGGPLLCPHLFERPEPGVDDSQARHRFRLGLNASSRAISAEAAFANGLRADLPRMSLAQGVNSVSDYVSEGMLDQDRGVATWEPLVADLRNDDNAILSQLTRLFLTMHNEIVHRLGGGDVDARPGDLYRRARHVLESAYRQIIRKDYLPLVLQTDALDARSGAPRQAPGLPAEFTIGAMRFGHFMIRPSYKLNWLEDGATGDDDPYLGLLVGLPELIKKGPNSIIDRPVAEYRRVDWGLFFDFGDHSDGSPMPQGSRLLTVGLPAPLAARPELFARSDDPPDLPAGGLFFRDLARAETAGLETGQAVAREYGCDATIDIRQLPVFRNASDELPPELLDRLAQKTPLLLYLMAEAELKQQGRKLGELGSLLVADTIRAALKNAGDRPGDPQAGQDIITVFGDAGLPENMPTLIRLLVPHATSIQYEKEKSNEG